MSPYCDTYGGIVLNATIDRYCYATVEETLDGSVEFRAADMEANDQPAPGEDSPRPMPLNLHQAIYERLNRDFDLGQRGVRVTTFSDAPPGSGLGSSSALSCRSSRRFVNSSPCRSGVDVARLAFEIERQDYGQAGGSQDQYAATFGGFNMMEFGPDSRIVVNPLRIKDETLSELEASMVLSVQAFRTFQPRSSNAKPVTYRRGQNRKLRRILNSRKRRSP